jgi:hemolysin activation/secretion protein
MDRRGRLIAAACALGLSLFASGAAAQVTPPPRLLPSPQEVQPAERPQAQPPARDTDVFAPEGPGPCPLRGSDLTFTLSSVAFDGATAVGVDELAKSYLGMVGREIPVSAICDIRDRASEILFRRGVLARVEVPEQRIESGALRFVVIEARIASLRIRGDAGPAQAAVETYLDKLRGMTPFDLDAAQRYLLLASEVPGVRLSAAIRPSSAGRGAVDLDVTLGRDPIDLLLAAQNLGSETIGPWGGLARVDFQGFTRFGERTSIVLYATPDDEQRVVQLLQEARIGAEGLKAQSSFAYGVTKPGGLFEPLDLESVSIVADLALAYPLVRKRRQNLWVSGGLAYVDQTTEFAGGATLTQDKLRVAFARADGDLQLGVFNRPLLLKGGLEARKGLEALGASQAGDRGLSRFEGRPDALVLRLDGGAEAIVTRRISAVAKLAAQYADEPLLSYEELTVGNLTIGRGYDPASATADRGVAGSIELRVGPFSPLRWGQVSAYAFYDTAWLDDLDIGSETRSVASAGGGLRLALTDRVSLDVAYAHPFDKPFPAADDKPDPRVLVSLVARVF